VITSFVSLFSSSEWNRELYIHVTVRRNKFLFNNQPDTLIIQIYSVIKLCMFGAGSILTLLGSCHQNLHETYQW